MADVQGTTTEQEEVEAIMLALDAGRREFPKAAIQAARRLKQPMIPKLIEALRSAIEDVKRGEEHEGNAAFFAFFLLAEFRAPEALPAIIDAISLPGEGPFELFGDAITEDLARVLLSIAGEQAVPVCAELIGNAAINEYVRWQATHALAMSAIAGLRPRAEVVQLCKELLAKAIEAKDENGVLGLVMSMVELNPWEAAAEIKAAFEQGLVDESMIDWKSAEETLCDKPPGPTHSYMRTPFIEDTIEEIGSWASFRGVEDFDDELDDDTDEFDTPKSYVPRHPAHHSTSGPMVPVHQPIRVTERVGRNDPCPCGSGKKFKRCCGGRG